MDNEDSWTRDLLDLKRTPRSGWFRIGVERPESVADHSLAVALLAWRLARARGLDPERALLMGLLHDFHEARLGDLPKPAQAYLPSGSLGAAEERIAAEQWASVAPEIGSLLAEFRQGTSPTAAAVRAADRLELLLQARRYRDAGYAGAAAFISELERDPELANWASSLAPQGDSGRKDAKP